MPPWSPSPPARRMSGRLRWWGSAGWRSGMRCWPAVRWASRGSSCVGPSPAAGGGQPSQYRDSAHAVGTIAVLSNRREGTLEVLVAPPERDPDPGAVAVGGHVGGGGVERAAGSSGWSPSITAPMGWVGWLRPGWTAGTRRLAPEQLGKLRSLLPQLPGHMDGLVDVAERPCEPAQFRDIPDRRCLQQVQDAYRRAFTDAPVPIGPPVSWTLTELSGLRRE